VLTELVVEALLNPAPTSRMSLRGVSASTSTADFFDSLCLQINFGPTSCLHASWDDYNDSPWSNSENDFADDDFPDDIYC
jgi:hypothetical protein